MTDYSTNRTTHSRTWRLPHDRGTVIVQIAVDGPLTYDEVRLVDTLNAHVETYCVNAAVDG